MKSCPKCKDQHEKSGIFCSRRCANSRTFSAEAIEKKRQASIKNGSRPPPNHHLLRKASKEATCNSCKREFMTTKRVCGGWKTYCSDLCFIAIKRKNALGIKRHIYDGITYDSGWELELAKWFESRGIEFERPSVGIIWIDNKGKQRKYFPDFFLPQWKLFVDPKNPFCIEEQKEKLDAVSKQINLIYGDVDKIKEKVVELQL